MKTCTCRACRRALHTKAGGIICRKAVKSHRQKVKTALKRGDEAPKEFSIGFIG